MANNQGFSKQQVAQLKEILDDRLEAQDIRIVTELDRRFAEQDQRIDAKFAAQDQRIDAKLTEERSYYRQLLRQEFADIRQELAEIRVRLQVLSERTDEDDRKAFKEITLLKRRLTKAETQISQLQASH